MKTLMPILRPSVLSLIAFGGLTLACSSGPATSAATPPVPVAAHPAPAPAQTPPAPEPEASRQVAGRLPDRLNDRDYWVLETDISEPGGYFRIEDNYTSNEMEVGQLYTMLRDMHVAGDVYMGVGPEQNFTYIAAIRPKMAFIVDIRRQAIMQHLMYKAMFEMAKDRADFISILFAKPRPAGLDSTTPIQKVWEAYRTVPTDSAAGSRNYARVVERLTKTHGFTFSAEEMSQLTSVFNAFYYYGPSITTRGGAAAGRGGDFSDLTGFANDNSGQPRSFLSTEENYRFIKMLHERNLIVPVSGDFAGPKAIRAIGTYLKEHHGTLRAFYVSNVEQYLFGDGKAAMFYANVATLPVDSSSVFIRPYSMRRGGGGVTSLCPIAAFLRANDAQHVYGNDAALACPQT